MLILTQKCPIYLILNISRIFLKKWAPSIKCDYSTLKTKKNQENVMNQSWSADFGPKNEAFWA